MYYSPSVSSSRLIVQIERSQLVSMTELKIYIIVCGPLNKEHGNQ